MPKRDIDIYHFDQERPEWTERKHALVDRYFLPGAMKLQVIRREVALVDGYAGRNSYGGKIKGSTVIMVEAARKVIQQGSRATVYACEPNLGRFTALEDNLSKAIEEGILVTFNSTHAQKVEEIIRRIGPTPALVFLDPQSASELTIEGDIKSWANRAYTDVLGVFMGGDACRVCASAVKQGLGSDLMAASLGPNWEVAITEDGAFRVFFNAIANMKKFSGFYALRKQEPKKNAYGIFGLSDSAHGISLLSDAVAKDWGLLKDFDGHNQTPDMFAEDDLAEAFDKLVGMCLPIVRSNPGITSEILSIKIFETDRGSTMFGEYKTSDFTKALRKIRAESERKP